MDEPVNKFLKTKKHKRCDCIYYSMYIESTPRDVPTTEVDLEMDDPINHSTLYLSRDDFKDGIFFLNVETLANLTNPSYAN